MKYRHKKLALKDMTTIMDLFQSFNKCNKFLQGRFRLADRFLFPGPVIFAIGSFRRRMNDLIIHFSSFRAKCFQYFPGSGMGTDLNIFQFIFISESSKLIYLSFYMISGYEKKRNLYDQHDALHRYMQFMLPGKIF
jgi:hypothetical protein